MKRNGGFMESLVWHAYEHSFHKWRRNVPFLPAALLSAVNTRSKRLKRNPYYVHLPSCDGSRQLTHPDAAVWRSELWLCATPYPYSKESYENPCVYRSEDGRHWLPCRGAYPLDKIQSGEIGKAHFSDPVLLPADGCLMLYYRKRTRKNDVNTDALYLSCTKDGEHWEKPRIVSESNLQNFISPAAVIGRNGFLLFHIDLYSHRQTGALIARRSGDGIAWMDETACAVGGLRPDTGLWHIAVTRTDGGDLLAGLFVIKKVNGEYAGVYRAFSSDEGLTWRIDGKLVLPGVLEADLKKPYKATFIPGSEDVMISLEDVRGRWYIYRVPGIFSGTEEI